MPEGCDVKDFSTQINEEVLHSGPFFFNKVFTLAPPAQQDTDIKYKRKQQEALDLINQIQLPCKLLKAKPHGKELALYLQCTNTKTMKRKCSKQYIRLQFYKGSYFHYGPLSDLNKFPLNTFSNLVFTTKDENNTDPMSLFIVDCRGCSNFISWEVRFGWIVHWKHPSPCVLTEHEIRMKKILYYADNNPELFQGMSLLSLTYDQEWSNGFGAYMTSEGLHRFYLATGLPPTTLVSELMKPSNRDLLLKWLEIPRILNEELLILGGCNSEIDIKKGYQPSVFGPTQRQMRSEFRLSFLQVYRKLKCNGKPVISVCFRKDSQIKVVYMLKECIPESILPSDTTTQSKLEETSAFKIGKEKWFLTDNTRGELTLDRLGVGPWDWFLGKDIKEARETGLPISFQEKGPSITLATSTKRKSK